MTRGRCGSLALRRVKLSFTAPCRFDRRTRRVSMSTLAKNTTATIIPAMRYRNAPAAIDWLCHTFRHRSTSSCPSKTARSCTLKKSGNGMLMCGSVLDTPFGKLMKQPDEIHGCETQSAYVIVERRRRDVRARQGGRRRDPARHQERGPRRARLLVPRPPRATSGTSGATIPGPRTDHGPEEGRTIMANEQAVRHHGSELPPPMALYQMAVGRSLARFRARGNSRDRRFLEGRAAARTPSSPRRPTPMPRPCSASCGCSPSVGVFTEGEAAGSRSRRSASSCARTFQARCARWCCSSPASASRTRGKSSNTASAPASPPSGCLAPDADAFTAMAANPEQAKIFDRGNGDLRAG